MFKKKKEEKNIEIREMENNASSDVKFFISLLLLVLPFLAVYMKRYLAPKTNKNSRNVEVRVSTPEERAEENNSDEIVVLKSTAPKRNVEVGDRSENKQTDTKNNLTARQQEILDFIKGNKDVDTSILHAKFKDVTVRTIRRDLNVLIDLGLIDKHGETKGVTYSSK